MPQLPSNQVRQPSVLPTDQLKDPPIQPPGFFEDSDDGSGRNIGMRVVIAILLVLFAVMIYTTVDTASVGSDESGERQTQE